MSDIVEAAGRIYREAIEHGHSETYAASMADQYVRAATAEHNRRVRARWSQEKERVTA